MVITDKLKQIVFKRLYKELGNVEIIPYNNSIWFIDREKEYWYFEFDRSGTLWWRYHFFNSFFELFSMDRNEFTPILSSWVEEVLNNKVSTTLSTNLLAPLMVEEVLNHKVATTKNSNRLNLIRVENALKYKVSTIQVIDEEDDLSVEEVLNHKVTTTQTGNAPPLSFVKDVLDYKVKQTKRDSSIDWVNVEGILNHK